MKICSKPSLLIYNVFVRYTAISDNTFVIRNVLLVYNSYFFKSLAKYFYLILLTKLPFATDNPNNGIKIYLSKFNSVLSIKL